MSAVLLLISDSLPLSALAHRHLAECGWPLHQVRDARTGMRWAADRQPAMLLVDAAIDRPGVVDLLHHVRRHSRVPVIVISSFGAGTDVAALLECGADDVVANLVEPAEMVARVKAVLRRGDRQPQAEQLSAAGVRMSAASRAVQVRGDAVALTAAEYDLLACLVRSAGRVVERDALVNAVSRRESSPLDRSLDVHVSRLRRKLGRQAPRILTMRGVGYMLAVGDPMDGDGMAAPGGAVPAAGAAAG